MNADLHSHVIEPVLDLFAHPTTSLHNAPFVFSAHTPQVLNVLNKAQVLFVEKRDCQSTVYRADTIKGLRADDKLLAKYMAGALARCRKFDGPLLGDDDAANQLLGRHGPLSCYT